MRKIYIPEWVLGFKNLASGENINNNEVRYLLLIDDKELVEGIVGGIAWVFFIVIFKTSIGLPLWISGFLAWALFWYVRKVGVRLYKYHEIYKKQTEHKNH